MEADGAAVDRYKPRGALRLRARARGQRARAQRVPSARRLRFARNLRSRCSSYRWACGSDTAASNGRCWSRPCCSILIVELLNSAIEATVDRIGFERHTLAGLAKDIGSAAVLMSFVLLGVVWLLVLLGR